MLDFAELSKAAADINRIEQAGVIDELWGDIHEALKNHPAANDLDNCTIGTRPVVELFAKLVKKLLPGQSDDQYLQAAIVAKGVQTRQGIILQAIAAFIAELDGTVKATSTPTGTPEAIQRARKPR